MPPRAPVTRSASNSNTSTPSSDHRRPPPAPAPAPEAGPSRSGAASGGWAARNGSVENARGNGGGTAQVVSLLQSGMIPPNSPLHDQASTSTLTLTPRSPASPRNKARSSLGATGRPLSSTPKGASAPSTSGTPSTTMGTPVVGAPGAGAAEDPLGLRRRAGTRPARPSSLGSFMSLPGRVGEQLVPDAEGDAAEVGARGDGSVQMDVEAEIAATTAAAGGDASLEATEDDEEPWTLIDRLRLWRDDAFSQHLHSTASFWGGKVWLLTGDPNDAFWLAQVYFAMGMFARAEKVLTGPRRVPTSTAAAAQEKGKGKETNGVVNVGDLTVHDEGRSFADVFYTPSAPAPPRPPLHPPKTTSAHGTGPIVRLTDFSIACRYLAAQCMVRQGKWSEALTMLGETNPFRPVSNSSRNVNGNGKGKSPATGEGAAEEKASADGGIKFEASMCHLRGVVHLHHKATDKAKECFMEALSLDVKCFESFEALVGGSMLEPEEEWEFVQSLAYHAQTPHDATFIKSIYTSRLKKYAPHLEEVKRSLGVLREEFGMRDDPDVMFAAADFLFSAWRWADCYRVTSRILALHDLHAPTLPLHLTCMYHLTHTHAALFVLAHDLIERDPDSAVSWYAAGLWYFAQNRWEECRRFFSKAAMLDTRFAPAWFGFGHSLALEGEHDQAITAYSTAQHHFQGTHLPLLFIGMQHSLLGNTSLAQDYLDSAYAMCKDDPLLLNERGVVAYYENRWRDAIKCFEEALVLAKKVQCAQTTWAPTYLNLCHCRRNIKQYKKALEVGKKALELDPRSAATLTALGMVYQCVDRIQEAIEYYHQSLALLPADPVTTDLLKVALDRSSFLNVSQSPGTSFHYPGLPFAVGYTLDNEVDQDDEEVARYEGAPRIEEHVEAGRRRRGAGEAETEDGEQADGEVEEGGEEEEGEDESMQMEE